MCLKPHWSINFILRRIPDYVDQWRSRSEPWLNYKIREALDSLLLKTDIMVECGSGRSTAWFGSRVGSLLSIEFNAKWFECVQSTIRDAGLSNVDLRFVRYSIDGNQQDNEYIEVLRALATESVDVALVDGGPRSYCAAALIPKLRPGGMLVIDDVHHFMPSKSKSPYAVRREADIPELYLGSVPLNWREVYGQIKGWRRLWTSNGVRDTAIFFKPSA